MTEWSQVPALVGDLAPPEVLGRELKQRIQTAYAALYKARGEVQVPEDTYDMLRRLAAEWDRFKGYGRAFSDAVKLLAQLMEEELTEAVGEQEGIPNQGLTVPDAAGDFRISLDTPRVYEIDMDQVWAVIQNSLEDRAKIAGIAFPIPWAVHQVVNLLPQLGKFEPQVSKLKAYAATLARDGDDKAASVVSGAITSKTPFKGVKFERNNRERP